MTRRRRHLCGGGTPRAADAYAKGAEIQFGISGSEADLAGDTNVSIKGDKGGQQPTSDVKATDTQIDIEVSKAPDMSGLVEVETKKVTMKGKPPKADGTKITVNLSVKLENTTIIYKHTGTLKGGNVVLDGAFDIKDSTIEIDLPEGAEVEATSGEGVKRELKGVKVKVTKVGSGSGIGPGGDKAATGGEKPSEGAGATPADPDAAERSKLVTEIQADPQLEKVYDEIFKKVGTPDLEVLRRLAALKARLAAKPELVEKLLGNLQKGEPADPIKDLIEPMEQALAALERGEELKPAEEPADAQLGTPAPSAPPAQKSEDKPKAEGVAKAEPTEAEKAQATGVEFWAQIRAKQATFKRWTLDKDEEAPPEPTQTGKLPVNLTIGKSNAGRLYNFWAHGTLVKPHDTPKPGFQWSGDYEFAAPSGIFRSTKGDKPIYFTDAGKKHTMTWGLLVKPKKTKKSKRKK